MPTTQRSRREQRQAPHRTFSWHVPSAIAGCVRMCARAHRGRHAGRRTAASTPNLRTSASSPPICRAPPWQEVGGVCPGCLASPVPVLDVGATPAPNEVLVSAQVRAWPGGHGCAKVQPDAQRRGRCPGSEPGSENKYNFIRLCRQLRAQRGADDARQARIQLDVRACSLPFTSCSRRNICDCTASTGRPADPHQLAAPLRSPKRRTEPVPRRAVSRRDAGIQTTSSRRDVANCCPPA